MRERRIFQRFNIELPIKFRSLNSDIKGTGKIINISASGGGMIVTAKRLELGMALEIELNISDDKAPLNANAEVVWFKAIEPPTFLVGVKFDKVDFMGIARALRLQDAQQDKNEN